MGEPPFERATQIQQDLIDSGCTAEITEDILQAALMKFSRVSALSGAMVYFNAHVGDIVSDPVKTEFLVSLCRELIAVAGAAGSPFPAHFDAVDDLLQISRSVPPDYRTSLMYDIEAGRTVESKTMFHEPYLLGRRLGLAMDSYRKVCVMFGHENPASSGSAFAFTAVGGPTVLLELGGLRILVDPTSDEPQSYPAEDNVPALTKTAGPAISAEEILPIDVALITHAHHIDHLDNAGRALLEQIAVIVTTRDGSERLGAPAQGLADFDSTTVQLPAGGELTITALPAQHGPDEIVPMTGQVIGFLLSGDGLPSIYVSGDNWSLEVGKAIAERVAPVDVAVMYGGGARFAEILNGVEITMPKEQSAEVARLLGAKRVIPAHTEGWAHSTEDYSVLKSAFVDGGLADRFIDAEFGHRVVVEV